MLSSPPQAASRLPPQVLQRSIEWPTVALLVATYGIWLALTEAWERLPLVLVVPAIALLLTFHSSLQHEIVHGHPTRWRAVNRLLGSVPLSLWLPFERYRVTHLTHHHNARLTDPYDDPESWYWMPEDWSRLSAVRRTVTRIQTTLAGRMIIGSFWVIGCFLLGEFRSLRRGVPGIRATWAAHILWCVPVILWLKLVCHMPLLLYVGLMVIPGNGILLIRSFAEHRARGPVAERTAIVERSWLLGPLFLFNNLHALHHEAPRLPWYALPARYRRDRERLIVENGGLVYRSYVDVARRYLFTPHDVPVHPQGGVPR